MSRRVLILDTSVLCCWLQVPGKLEAGPVSDRWTFERIDALLAQEQQSGSLFVLPLATLIETGNHIAQAPSQRRDRAHRLAALLGQAAQARSPWAAFTEQSALWAPAGLSRLAESWPPLAESRLSMGDATIKEVAEFYAKVPDCHIEILTGDAGLKAYEPIKPVLVPRRRR